MRNELIVHKLIAYTERILNYCEGVSFDAFTSDSMLTDACVFNLSQMGELAKHVDSDFAQTHPEVPWRTLYGLRNRIVHDYEGVNLQLIWEIVSDDLPDLLNRLKAIKI